MTDEQTQTQQAPLNNDGGNKPSTDDLIRRADTLKQELEAQTKKAEELKKQNEELYTRITLGGRGVVAEKTKELSPDEKNLQDARSYFKGSQIERYLK